MLLNDIKQSNFEEPKTILFESGKFGVGISTLTVNCAIFLSDLGYRAIAIESGLGGSNLRCFLGFQNQHPVVGVILKAKKGHLSENAWVSLCPTLVKPPSWQRPGKHKRQT